LIEIKSPWTLKLDPAKNRAKFQAALDLGYNFEVRVYDQKGEYYNLDIERFINDNATEEDLDMLIEDEDDKEDFEIVQELLGDEFENILVEEELLSPSDFEEPSIELPQDEDEIIKPSPSEEPIHKPIKISKSTKPPINEEPLKPFKKVKIVKKTPSPNSSISSRPTPISSIPPSSSVPIKKTIIVKKFDK
jgi:hypothetical protein